MICMHGTSDHIALRGAYAARIGLPLMIIYSKDFIVHSFNDKVFMKLAVPQHPVYCNESHLTLDLILFCIPPHTTPILKPWVASMG